MRWDTGMIFNRLVRYHALQCSAVLQHPPHNGKMVICESVFLWKEFLHQFFSVGVIFGSFFQVIYPVVRKQVAD